MKSFGYEIKIENGTVSSIHSINGKDGKFTFYTVLPHEKAENFAIASACRHVAYDLLFKAAALTTGDVFSLMTQEDIQRQVDYMLEENRIVDEYV